MFKNYLTIAWRQILKNKLYASINILGLVTGLSVYVFGYLLVAYENSHDAFFRNVDRVYTAGSVFSPAAQIGVTQNDGIYTGFGPIIEANVTDIEAVARTVRWEFLVSVEDNHYYEHIKFTDPAFLTIFDFNYLEGDDSALDNPDGVMLSASAAEKFFGPGNVIGRTLELDHNLTLQVTAVIEDLPRNSHLSSSVIGAGDGMHMVAPLAALNRAVEYDLAGNWNNLSSGDLTYMMFPAGTTMDDVQAEMDRMYDDHMLEDRKEFITGLKARKLIDTNTIIWDMVGIPVMESVQILALLVLIVAIVNYTNLATAQSMARAREVGLRKTMGADQQQLLSQFMIESICIVAISMLITLAVLEMIVPLFNEAAGRALTLDYVNILPWLIATTVIVGLVAGGYPAYLITRATPIDALRESRPGTVKGGVFRSVMLGLQFTISIFMLAMVIVVYFQNQKVVESSQLFPRDEILLLQRLNLDEIHERRETLRNELKSIPGISNVTFSSQVPYEQSHSGFGVSLAPGDEEHTSLMQIRMDDLFLETYNIELLAGRNLDLDLTADTVREDVFAANILVNELALEELGFGSPAEALGKVVYDTPDDREPRAYTIVGVVPSQNFQGFHNQIHAMVFLHSEETLRLASIRVTAGTPMHQVMQDIESAWQRVIPEYPMQSEFLNETFDDTFTIFNLTTQVLGGFALIALLLSTIGLFGLAAFMAQNRTREIGIRKVMGANVVQIVRLLIWQFSKPVMWSLLVALPLAYFASNTYLNFFADRIAAPSGIVFGSGVAAVLFAWLIVAIHAIRIAHANPIKALRYE